MKLETTNLKEIEQLVIRKVLADNPDKKLSSIAYFLGISERTLHRKIALYKINRTDK